MLCITQPLQIDALLAECSQDKHFSSTVPTPDPFVAHSPVNSYKPHVLRSLCRISKSKSELPKDMQTAGFWSPQVAVAAANDTACSESPLQDLPVHIRQQIFDSVLEHPPGRNQIGLCNEWLTSAGWIPNGQPIPFSQVLLCKKKHVYLLYFAWYNTLGIPTAKPSYVGFCRERYI